jgi:hypothetical protein
LYLIFKDKNQSESYQQLSADNKKRATLGATLFGGAPAKAS